VKVSCSFFCITMLKKLPYRHVYSDGDKRGMLPIFFLLMTPFYGVTHPLALYVLIAWKE